MAFIGGVSPAFTKQKLFFGEHVTRSQEHRLHHVSGIRMGGLTDKERKSFAPVGGESKWRENPFTGGFPGGEAAFNDWLDKGMKTEVEDLPDYLQPTKSFEKSVDSRAKPTVLQTAEKKEFFSAFKDAVKNVVSGGGQSKTEDTEAEAEPEVAAPVDAAPDESLYEKYYPKKVRNLAPFIDITYVKDFYKDRVGVSMQEVSANPTDVYFPKETSGKAPFIDIQYNGNLATAKVGVSMKTVTPLPSVAPPVAKGETVTKLVPGAGGGLKLDFETQE